MRSPAERARLTAEWLLRAVVIIVLALALAASLGLGGQRRTETVASDELEDALERWSITASPATVHAHLTHAPAAEERDWLAALSGAGTSVGWSGPEMVPAAIDIELRADPQGGADITVAAPEDAAVVLRDTVGVLDSMAADAGSLRAFVERPAPAIDAVVGALTARAALRDSLHLRRLLVIGAAGWETKFTIAALEERGWNVDARVRVSPETLVRQGEPPQIDTARYAAILVIDTTAAPFADRIVRYVREGGGLLLWSQAARAFAPVAAGRAGELIEHEGRLPRDTLPRQGLSLVPITAAAEDAIAIEMRDGHIALAALRVERGRVIQIGYTDSWRWRMAGDGESPDRHRAWLAALVANVAYAPATRIAARHADPAPLAALVQRLGPRSEDAARAGFDPETLARWAFAILCLALLAEWASRRIRGAR